MAGPGTPTAADASTDGDDGTTTPLPPQARSDRKHAAVGSTDAAVGSAASSYRSWFGLVAVLLSAAGFWVVACVFLSRKIHARVVASRRPGRWKQVSVREQLDGAAGPHGHARRGEREYRTTHSDDEADARADGIPLTQKALPPETAPRTWRAVEIDVD